MGQKHDILTSHDQAAAAPLPIDVLVGQERVTSHTRIRKRRRSASSAIDETEPNLKRPDARKAHSPISKRTPTTTNTNTQGPRDGNPCQGIPHSKQDATIKTLGGNERQDDDPLRKILQEDSGGSSISGNGSFVAEPNPDMHAVISKIIDHGETVDSQYGAHGDNANGLAQVEGILPQGASKQLKIQSLPILDNLVSLVLLLCG